MSLPFSGGRAGIQSHKINRLLGRLDRGEFRNRLTQAGDDHLFAVLDSSENCTQMGPQFRDTHAPHKDDPIRSFA
jgi:hypothetical protein